MSAAPEPAHAQEQRSGGWRSTLVLGLALVALVHSLLIALWLAPSGPVRQAVGPDRLATYVDPYFTQAWDVLEPSSQRVDETLRVRARVRVDAETVEETPWIDVTAADLASARGDATPARVHLAGRRLATNLNNVMFQLGNAGRVRVADSYAGRPVGELRGVLLASDVPAEAVRTYMDLDLMASRFASLYTQASADLRVVQVQYRVGRRVVPARGPEADRVRDLPWEWFDFGWRGAERGSADAQAAFDSFVGDR